MSAVTTRARPASAAILAAAAGLAALAWRSTLPPLRPAAVAAIGLGGVLAAWAIAAPAPSFPIGAWTLPIGMLAAGAEELLFRRVLYGVLAPRSEALAVSVTAVAFAVIHVPLYGVAALPVDLGAGLLLSWQRWASGSCTASAATHAVANVLAVIR